MNSTGEHIMTEAEGQTPLAWLWEQITNRSGADITQELRRGFNEQQRRYSKHRHQANAHWQVAREERVRQLAEEANAQPWTHIRLVPGAGKWAPILAATVRGTFPHTMLQQQGENWLLSFPPGRPFSEQDERHFQSLKDQEMLGDWQHLPPKELQSAESTQKQGAFSQEGEMP